MMNPTQLIKRDPVNSLFAVIAFIHPVSAQAEAYARQNVSVIKVARGNLLVKSGQHCDHMYFVQKGVLRGFTCTSKKEITTWITAENEMVSSISSFFQSIPSFENIEAIEECLLIAIHRNAIQYMYAHFPEVNVVARIIFERYYQDAEERAYICRLTEATAKYTRFINTKSHLLNRIPLKYVASYLGMTLETLSRIRSRLSHHR